MLAAIPVSSLGTPGTVHSLSISGWLWSFVQSNMNVWLIIAAIGIDTPTSNETKQDEDFTKIGYTEEKAGWTEYKLKKRITLPINNESLIYFAFGVSVTWETPRTYWIDYLTIKIDNHIFNGSPVTNISPGFEHVILFSTFVFIFSLRKRKKKKCLKD